MLPEVFTWWAIGILGALMVLDRLVDFFATAVGTKWFGGTKWGIIGALVGGFLGLFFGIVGILIGPVVGAVVFEMVWAKRHPKEAGAIWSRRWGWIWIVSCRTNDRVLYDDGSTHS